MVKIFNFEKMPTHVSSTTKTAINTKKNILKELEPLSVPFVAVFCKYFSFDIFEYYNLSWKIVKLLILYIVVLV